ncbi:hypothetical protein N1031_03390 [Herbiconiux moechotypicola]|uniref:MoeA N-terminal and linker domain-containing protein n=1 Tax=Herbiconiux moechotypicola TaxID=637393 RepID=A0ABP5Q8G6_9MICO|nr:hypothetical protein [Herbiconiux moechotypicola]MCS5728793.1 hypothetical protein [Herbiconiux moechotypicola]
MTLTTILPSLRTTLPDPIALDRWPEQTHPTVDDVVVGGVSLRRLVDICETPCVHVAAAVVPGSGGRPSDREQASVVVTKVLEVTGDGMLVLDAELSEVAAHFDEARLIGRASTRRATAFAVGNGAMVLPADVRAGDLVSVPCRGAVCCRHLRGRAVA